MKKITEAYNDGVNGDALRDRAGRVIRVAHWFGRQHGKLIDSENALFDKQRDAVLATATEKAVGLNKTALQIIEAAAGIPHPSQSDIKGATGAVDPKTHRRLRYDWLGDFSYGKQAVETAIVPTALDKPLADLQIGHTSMPADLTVDLPISRILITSEAEVGETGSIMPATTKIDINPFMYDPDDAEGYHDTAITSAQIEVGPNGQVTGFGVMKGTIGGYDSQDLTRTTINIDAIMTSLHESVVATAAVYDAFRHEEGASQ